MGYEFANSQIITIDSTFLHKTAVKPALKILFEEGFEGAEDEIRNAYERRRKGDNKNAILEAGKAFENKDMHMIKTRILRRNLLQF